MFRKKKPSEIAATSPVLRGRHGVASGSGAERGTGDNPLARRFHAGGEPATVDLGGPARFPEPAAAADPKTAPLQTDAAKLARVISHDPETGKFYVHPGTADCPVALQGEPVLAPTELRRGDSIRVGTTEIHFGSTM